MTATTDTTAVPRTCQEQPTGLTVAEAHTVMQEHAWCLTVRCRQRATALAMLVDSGRYVLARV